MWGYRLTPAHNQTGVTRREEFKCSDLCRRQGTNELDAGEQALRRCALPSVNRGTWANDEEVVLVPIHLGAPPRFDREGKDADPSEPHLRDWYKPLEPTDEGCPGAWYRTAFMVSLLRYYRARDEHGGRVSNPALDQSTDHLVHEAIRELELHEDSAFGDYLDYVRKQRPPA